MLRFPARLVLAVVLCSIPKELPAEPAWCYTNQPDALFCNDFDRMCVEPPPEPERCDPPPDTNIKAPELVPDLWRPYDPCGWAPGLHDVYCASYPYCAKIGSQDGGNHLGNGTATLTSYIRSHFGDAYSAVLPSDLTPLTFEFSMTGRTLNKIRYANMYMEIGYGRTQPMTAGVACPTNWTISPDCVPCGDDSGNTGYWPIICRQRSTPQRPMPAACPNIDTAPIIPAIAAGVLAHLDNNPCHCGEVDEHWPHADHLAFFDGRQWHILKRGLFPDPGGDEPAPGDFGLVGGDMQHRVRLTIQSTTVTVELRTDVLSRCEIPLAYVGPFNSLLMGFQTPCQLKPGTWECNGAIDCNGPCGADRVCCLRGAPGGGTVTVDDVAVRGGQGYAAPGACCFPDTSCVEALRGDCLLLGGQPADGGTACENTACCPPLPADHDMDTDVDLQDFGWFQTCFTGQRNPITDVPCTCADFDHDNDVDADDLVRFLGCMQGPQVLADPTCAD